MRNIKYIEYLIIVATIVSVLFAFDIIQVRKNDEECVEYIEVIQVTEPSPSPEPVIEEIEEASPSAIGKASYYSWDGCLGCNENRIMANGEQLDDAKLTVAYNRAELNSYVVIKNINTGAEVTAKVTDRGGFERHGKIVDLSVATKNAIGCGSVCPVEIYE